MAVVVTRIVFGESECSEVVEDEEVWQLNGSKCQKITIQLSSSNDSHQTRFVLGFVAVKISVPIAE